MEEKYRREMKYEISYPEYVTLQSRLKQVMKRDIHAGESGVYQIRSLYFDNYNDKALVEKLVGIKNRDKYRLRCYNNDFSLIHLEKKSKRNNLCLKKSCVLTLDECKAVLNGDVEFAAKSQNEVLADFYSAYTSQIMRPKTLVVYDREPFVYAPGNVRITFDSNIRSGLYHTDFLDTEHPLVPVLDGEKMILEIKFDEFLPDIIRHAVQCGIPRIQAFSKYAASRQYE